MTQTAVILGVGGLGCPAALFLCEEAQVAGFSLRLLLVDDDRVERSNLSRQILYREDDVGRFKVVAAARRLSQSAPWVEIVPRPVRFEASTSAQLLRGADVVLDGTDSFETRFAANDACCNSEIPLVHGAVLGWRGQLLAVLPRVGSCLRCLFEGPPPPGSLPSCAEAGVATPLCGVVGAAMAALASRILRGDGAEAAGRLHVWEGASGRQRAIGVPRDPGCPTCGASARAVRHPSSGGIPCP
ncbi:MAG: HesA/MoeB/ThiF family protein [Myxococcales bacterium]